MITIDPDTNGYDVLNITPGLSVWSGDREYVFIGWRRNTVAHEAVFAQVYDPDRFYGAWQPNDTWTYHATRAETLIRKFPGLAEYRQ